MAACINAETGVGPSIASGNHICKPIWADFDITAINIKNDIVLKSIKSNIFVIAIHDISYIFKVPI